MRRRQEIGRCWSADSEDGGHALPRSLQRSTASPHACAEGLCPPQRQEIKSVPLEAAGTVSQGRGNKSPQAHSFTPRDFYFLTALEPTSPKLRCRGALFSHGPGRTCPRPVSAAGIAGNPWLINALLQCLSARRLCLCFSSCKIHHSRSRTGPTPVLS